MTALVKVNDILDDTPTGVQPLKPSGEATNIVEMPSKETRPQDIVLNLYLRGSSLKSIAEVLGGEEKGWNEDKVQVIAESEWMSNRLQEISAASQQDEVAVEKLIAAHSFRAVIKLGKLMNSGSETIALRSCQTILSAAVALQTSKKTENKAPLKGDDAASRLAALDAEIDRLLSVRKKSA